MGGPSILMTNDDGIDAVGFRALYEALTSVGDVVGIAPSTDQSAVGRKVSQSVSIREHELGYEVDGTPADCVIAGLESLEPNTDLVVAGCNEGANLGAHVLGRSGTVGAAIESAFLGVPAMAVSLYVPIPANTIVTDTDISRDSYAEAIRATRHVAEHALDSGVFDHAEYLNINAPPAEWGAASMAITRPSHVYRMRASYEADRIELDDEIWAMMADGSIPDPAGTDRRAVVDGKVSVSPLTAPHTVEHHQALDALAETYDSDG